MILFINTFITESRLTLYYDRGIFPPAPSRFDIFRYTLASLAVLPWKDVYILYQLDDEFASRYGEMDAWIKQHFPASKVFHERCEYQPQWKAITSRVLQEHPQELVWFLGNDDHVFIDSQVEYTARLCHRLEELKGQYPYLSLIYSHWPQFLGGFYLEQHKNYIVEDTPDYALVYGRDSGSCAIWSAPTLAHFWLQRDFGGRRIYRADNVAAPDFLMMIPKREMVRHFDGYAHAGVDICAAPPLQIPAGFFENNIRIAYGGKRPSPEYTLFDPANPNYSISDPEGADYRLLVEEMPLFWKPRVAEIKKQTSLDEYSLIAHHNGAMKENALSYAHTVKGDIREMSPAAFIQCGEQTPIIEREKKPLPEGVREIQLKKRNWSAQSARHSIIILDNENSSWSEIHQFAREAQKRGDVELSWVSLTTKEYESPTREQTAVLDSIITVRFTGRVNKNIALREAMSHVRGEIITIVECIYQNFTITPVLLDDIAREFAGSLPPSKGVEHQLVEVQSPFENNRIEPVTQFINPIRCCFTMLRRDMDRVGGFETSERYAGARGGAYELFDRLKAAGVSTQIIPGNGAVYFKSLPFPVENVPSSGFYCQQPVITRGG